MTKKEIQARLKELGVDVTLRARKSTLEKLLVQEEAKDICKPEPKGKWWADAVVYTFLGMFIVTTVIFFAL